MLLSPAKTLDETTPVRWKEYTVPPLLSLTQTLMKTLRGYSADEIGTLMDVSDKLAMLNAERFQQFKAPFTPKNARPALSMFKGDVYLGLKAETFSDADMAFAQVHLRILSGLYGLLRPLDLMQPYRLEMGTPLTVGNAKHLYAFWQHPLAQALNDALAQEGSGIVLNLASEEYFKAVDAGAVKGRFVTVHFKERRGNALKTIGLFAKKARGAMAGYVIRNRIKDIKQLKVFKEGGYLFDAELSDAHNLMFARKSN